MVYFFGNTPQGALFEPIDATSIKFDGTTLVLAAADATALQDFVLDLKDDIQVQGRYQGRDLIFVDSTNNLTLEMHARYNATMHIQLKNTTTEELLSPLYCVCVDMDLMALFDTLFQ